MVGAAAKGPADEPGPSGLGLGEPQGKPRPGGSTGRWELGGDTGLETSCKGTEGSWGCLEPHVEKKKEQDKGRGSPPKARLLTAPLSRRERLWAAQAGVAVHCHLCYRQAGGLPHLQS